MYVGGLYICRHGRSCGQSLTHRLLLKKRPLNQYRWVMGGILSGRIRNHDVLTKLAAYMYIYIFGNVISSVIIGYKISVIYNSMYAEGFVETII